MSAKKFIWAIAGMDIFMSLAVTFIVLSTIAMANHNKQKVVENESHDLYVIKMQWNGKNHDDVDLYVRDPLNRIIYFRNMSVPGVRLERDDTGANSNMVTLPNGEVVESALNEEIVDISTAIPGEWIVNCHMFAKREDAPSQVYCALYKVAGGQYLKVADKIVAVTALGEENTFFRFTLTDKNEVVDINDNAINFVQAVVSNAPGTGTP